MSRTSRSNSAASNCARRRPHKLPGGGHVAANLFPQSFQRGKLHFGPQPGAKGYFHFLAVNLAFEVQQVDFDAELWRWLAKRRTMAKVDDGVMSSASTRIIATN